jgi:hypothetical protein
MKNSSVPHRRLPLRMDNRAFKDRFALLLVLAEMK